MELIALIAGGALGWKHASFGKLELQIMALVVVGWTAVTTVASVPYLTLDGTLFSLAYHAVLVAVPYSAGALAKRLRGRR